MSLQMRVGLGQFNELTDEKLAFIKQMGCDDFLMNTPKLPGDKQWEYSDLAALKKRADDAELRLMALEKRAHLVLRRDHARPKRPRRTTPAHDYHRAEYGQGRHPNPRLPLDPQQRPGVPPSQRPCAAVRAPLAFALAEHDPEELTHGRVFTHDEMWENYCWYLERILPVAEEADVRLALHPDDPPTGTTLGGIARICSSFRRLQAQHGHL